MSKLGVGLIGCGGMGRGLGKQLNSLEDAAIVGVTDVDPAAAERASAELSAPVFGEVEGLLRAPGLEAVVIASPPFLHRPHTALAAGAGKHVFVEKPMAASTADCDAMIEAAERSGITLMVGQVLRYYPCWSRVIELVRSGEIGEPWGISVTRIGGGWEGWPQAWRNSLEKSGGLLMEVNSHEIDFMCQVCGDVERVYAEAGHYGTDPSDYPNLYFLALRFRSGAVGQLHSSTVSALGEISGKIHGSEGTLIYTNGFGGDGEIRWAKRDGEPARIRIGDVHVENPVRKELRQFVEAIRTGQPPAIPGWEGRRNVAVAEAAYAAIRSGAPVRL